MVRGMGGVGGDSTNTVAVFEGSLHIPEMEILHAQFTAELFRQTPLHFSAECIDGVDADHIFDQQRDRSRSRPAAEIVPYRERNRNAAQGRLRGAGAFDDESVVLLADGRETTERFPRISALLFPGKLRCAVNATRDS